MKPAPPSTKRLNYQYTHEQAIDFLWQAHPKVAFK
jgi:hypothetical protein